MNSDDDFLMLSGIQHFSYCRRQWALIHISQAWEENYLTFRGKKAHRRAHDDTLREKRGSVITIRGLPVFSERLRYSGECDVIELHESQNGAVIVGRQELYQLVPVEYKSGKVVEREADKLQLCAEAMALEDMFLTDIPYGFLYYKASNKRVRIDFSDDLRNLVESYFMEMHDYYKKGYIPKVRKTWKCQNCSLSDICQPELFGRPSAKEYVKKYTKELVAEYENDA